MWYDWIVFSWFSKMISMKLRKVEFFTLGAMVILLASPAGSSGIRSYLNTLSAISKYSMSLSGVSGSLWDTPLIAYRSLPPSSPLVLTNFNVRVISIWPWRWGQFSCSGAFAVGIAYESHGGELLLEEPAGGHQVVILWILIGCDQNREALSGMEIKGIVIILHGLPSLKGRKWLHLVSDLAVLGVDHQPVRPGNGVAVVKGFLEVLVALVVPVAEEDIELVRGPIKRDGDEFTAVDSEGAVSTGRAVEVGAGEVEVGPDLILHLEMIGIVCTGHDGTHGSRHPILPGILPLLNTVPMEQQRLIQFIKHINNNVVVGCAVDGGARQFTVDENRIFSHTQRGQFTVRHLPVEEHVRILRLHNQRRGKEPKQEHHTHYTIYFLHIVVVL
nr:hypothetical protein ACMD2_04951 [Ipomoea trifida]